MSRPQLFQEMAAQIGTDTVLGVQPKTGWPGIMVVKLPSGRRIPVAAHVSTVGSHARKPYELRFQNPATRDPVSNPNGSLPILLGRYTDAAGSIFVGLDGRSRLDRDARFSILFNIRLVDEARANGWAIYTSSKGENIYGFHPSLFPLLVELVASGLDTASAAKETSDELGRLSIAAGLLDDDSPDARKRARRAADVLIRNRAFGSGVVRSYGGYCAMCGLDHGFTAGAHIYPASAPGSPDKVWNGLALCPNHHTAFDAHKIWVDPAEKSIKIHPKLLDESANNAALKAFLDCTFEKLNAPTPKAARPREEMFEKRYAYFGGRYEWV